MKLVVLLLCILLPRHCVADENTPRILPEFTVSALEREHTILRAVFGPNTLPSGSVLLVVLRKQNNESYAVAIGRKPYLQFVNASVDPKRGAYEVHIQNVSFEIHEGAYHFGVSSANHVSQFKQVIHLVVQQLPKRVIFQPAGRFEIPPDHYSNLTCKSIHRFAGCSFCWFRQKGRFVDPLLGVITSDPEKCTSMAMFRVLPEDNGMKVVCEIKNKNAKNSPTSSAKKKVNVKTVPRVEIIPKGKIRLLTESSINLACLAKSNSQIQRLEWLFQDSVIFAGNASLRLHAKPAIAGVYFCRATNSEGTSLASTFVEVQHPPDINLILDQEVDQGKNLTAVCMTLAVPPTALYLWERESVANFRAYGQHLVLRNVTPDMTDKFTCTAVNYIKAIGHSFPGIARKSFQLNVRHPPGVSATIPKNITELEGRTVEFRCKSHYPGHPPPVTRWMNAKGQVIGNETVLNLKVGRNNEILTCYQKNEMGRSTASSPANVMVLAVQQKEAKSILGRYNYETGTIKIETMDFTFPVTAKVDVLRKNSSSWEYLSKIVDSGTDITIYSPGTVVELRLLLCRESIKSCIRLPIIQERWDTDIDTTEKHYGVDEKTSRSVIGTLAVAFAASVVYMGLIVVVVFVVWKNSHRFPRLADIPFIRRLRERLVERQLELEFHRPQPVEPLKNGDGGLHLVHEYLV